jgi:Cu/Ag efflux protein CusF
MIDIRSALAASIAALALCGLAAASELAEGEVRKVDKESKKLTLKHGPLKNLDMPGMTMVFQVKEDALLDKVQTGDKVRFQAEKIDGKFTVTRLEAAR